MCFCCIMSSYAGGLVAGLLAIQNMYFFFFNNGFDTGMEILCRLGKRKAGVVFATMQNNNLIAHITE